MNQNLELNPADFYFIPMGGSEQFGVNFNLYAYQGRWLGVDCGIGFALRAAEMGEKDDLPAFVGDFPDGGQDALDARRVRHPAVLHGDVEVHPDENALSPDVGLVERAEGGH